MVLARKLRPLLYLTILLCALSIIVSSISLSGRSWYLRTAQHVQIAQSRIEIEYGLFSGIKVGHFETDLGSGTVGTYELAVVCEGDLCMFSCGLDGDRRQDDIRNLLDRRIKNDRAYCIDAGNSDDIGDPEDPVETRKALSRNDGVSNFEERFVNIGFWLGTIIPVAAGIMFSVIGMAFALYNTLESPTQPIFGIFGLYIWNGCATVAVLMGMIVWGICFSTGLQGNGAVSDTIAEAVDYTGNGSLGYSYWILILSIVFNMSNLGILFFHSWKLNQSERKITHVIDDKLKNGDILLF